MGPSLRSWAVPSHAVGIAIDMRSCGFSATTIDNYRREIERFQGGLGKPLEAAVRADLSAYISERYELSPNRVISLTRALRAFYKYLAEELEIVDPSAKLTKPKVPEAVTAYVTEADFDALSDACWLPTTALSCS